MTVYFDFADWWIGYYRGPNHHYVCPVPTVVIRWERGAMKRWLRYQRRMWCIRRGHPTYDVIVLWSRSPDILNEDGSITEGTEHKVIAVRCTVREPPR